MGQPAFCKGYVRFTNETTALLALGKFETWVEQAQTGKLPDPDDGDFSIGDIHTDGGEIICYEVDSMKYANCVWQCERIREFFKKMRGCVSVQQDIQTIEDSVNWDAAEDGDDVE